MTGELYNFKSAKPQTDFAPSWNFFVYENILNFDFDKVVNIILKKEKTIVKQYPPSNNGNTSLDNNSLTSRFPFFNVLKWKEMLFLKKLIKQNYNNYLNKIKLTPEKNIYLQCWANVLREGEQIKLHEHDTSCFAYLSGNIIIKSNNTNFKGVGQPLRVALTGSKFGPGIYDIIISLGKEEVEKRLTNKTIS